MFAISSPDEFLVSRTYGKNTGNCIASYMAFTRFCSSRVSSCLNLNLYAYLNRQRQPTSGPVSTWMGDRV